MDPTSAFTAATGLELKAVSFFFVALACVVAFYWASWALLSSYKGYTKDELRGEDFGGAVLRIFFLLIILLWVFL